MICFDNNEQYLQYTFYINNEAQAEILIALLSEIGFDGFEEKDNELLAYIDQLNINDDAVTENLETSSNKFFCNNY